MKSPKEVLMHIIAGILLLFFLMICAVSKSAIHEILAALLLLSSISALGFGQVINAINKGSNNE